MAKTTKKPKPLSPRQLKREARWRNPRWLQRTQRICRIIQWVLIPVMLLLAWMIVGLAMRAGVAPSFDLGYSWFDSHIYHLFGLA